MTQAAGQQPGQAGRIPELEGKPRPGTWSWPSPPDPGDLSRRIASRRAELRLSIEQVAVRAHMNPRYVEYLERYPARMSAAGLRSLAAALETTASELLGAGLGTPPGHGRPAGHRTLARLTRIECFELIAPGGIGRIAFPMGAGTLVLPINYIVITTIILFRTSPVGVIAAYANDSPVTFEVDRVDEALQQGWSVLSRERPARSPTRRNWPPCTGM